MRLLLDMNLSPEWVETLEAAGFPSAHWSTLGRANAPDSELMDYARRNGYVVFTHDLDFGTLLAHSRANGPSVVQLRGSNVDPATVGPAVVLALGQFRAELVRGALVTIDLRRAKARLLPLAP